MRKNVLSSSVCHLFFCTTIVCVWSMLMSVLLHKSTLNFATLFYTVAIHLCHPNLWLLIDICVDTHLHCFVVDSYFGHRQQADIKRCRRLWEIRTSYCMFTCPQINAFCAAGSSVWLEQAYWFLCSLSVILHCRRSWCYSCVSLQFGMFTKVGLFIVLFIFNCL